MPRRRSLLQTRARDQAKPGKSGRRHCIARGREPMAGGFMQNRQIDEKFGNFAANLMMVKAALRVFAHMGLRQGEWSPPHTRPWLRRPRLSLGDERVGRRQSKPQVLPTSSGCSCNSRSFFVALRQDRLGQPNGGGGTGR